MRDLRRGDIIHVQGIICEISEIAWQEPWEWKILMVVMQN